jgi:hypothetical protein
MEFNLSPELLAYVTFAALGLVCALIVGLEEIGIFTPSARLHRRRVRIAKREAKARAIRREIAFRQMRHERAARRAA